MQKQDRHKALLELIGSESLSNQAQVADRLRQLEFEVTQASISRDLNELGIIKSNGIYVLPRRQDGSTLLGPEGVETAGEALLVLKCVPGLASAIAVKIDSEKIPEIVGTIAGDDTIFIAVRDAADQKVAVRKVWKLFEK